MAHAIFEKTAITYVKLLSTYVDIYENSKFLHKLSYVWWCSARFSGHFFLKYVHVFI